MSDVAFAYVRAHYRGRVRGTAYQVLERLADYTHHHTYRCRRSCSREGLAFPSAARMGDELGVSRRTIYRAVQQLIDLEFITTQRTGRAPFYRIVEVAPIPPAQLVDGTEIDLRDPVEEGVESAAGQSQSVTSEVTNWQPRLANLSHDLPGNVHASTRAREAPPGGAAGEDSAEPSSVGHSPPSCRHHEQPHPSCSVCHAHAVLERARTRAKARSASRDAAAEREWGYGPRGTRPGPERLAGALDAVMVGITPKSAPGAAG
jgi:biotin operon repressor